MTAPAGRRRAIGIVGATAGAVAVIAVLVLGGGGRGHGGSQPVAVTAAGLPPAPTCPQSAEHPTSSSSYELPIANRIVNGTLKQGLVEISNINATVCGLLRFPSLSADIPASSIVFANSGSGQAKVTANLSGLSTLPTIPGVTIPGVTIPSITIPGITVPGLSTGSAAPTVATGYAIIHASGPSTAVTSNTAAPNGGLIFTLTAETSDVLHIGVGSLSVACDVQLSATLNTDPSKGGSALVGPLTGAQGTAYAPASAVKVSNLTPASSSPVDTTLCPILNAALKPSTTPTTFRAPLDFYSTLTHF